MIKLLPSTYKQFSLKRSLSTTTNTIIESRKYSFKEKYGSYINGKEDFPNSLDNIEFEKINGNNNPAFPPHPSSYIPPSFSSQNIDLYCPAYPSAGKLTTLETSSSTQIRRAIAIAQQKFEEGVWSKQSPLQRATVLREAERLLRLKLPELVQLEVAQTGRAIREMQAQLGRLPEWLGYFASCVQTDEGTVPPFSGNYINYVKRVPLGTVSLLTPWNHPMLIATKKLAPALAAGNSVILKPSELAPVTLLKLAEIFTEAGLPDGVLNIVTGEGPTVGSAIVKHPFVRHVDLTGGTQTGKVVGELAGSNLCSMISELGGKAPLVIFDDCNVDDAVNGAAFAAFVASGQTCVMGSRLIVHEKIYDEFVSKLINKMQFITGKMTDPFDSTCLMGPVISKKSYDNIYKLIDGDLKNNAKLLHGAKKPEHLEGHLKNGYFIEPTLIEVDPKKHTLWREEAFGPLTVITKFSSEKEGIELANDSPYGLAASVWTRDVMRGHRVSEQLNVGLVWINDHHRNDPSSVWGGMKLSGIGRENGRQALHAYTQLKSTIVRYDDSPFDWFSQPNARYG